MILYKNKNEVIAISEFPKAPTTRIMKNAGAQRISGDAVDELLSAMESYGTNIASKANALAHHAGRKTVKASDIKLAMK